MSSVQVVHFSFGLSVLFARVERSEGECAFGFHKEIDAILLQIVSLKLWLYQDRSFLGCQATVLKLTSFVTWPSNLVRNPRELRSAVLATLVTPDLFVIAFLFCLHVLIVIFITPMICVTVVIGSVLSQVHSLHSNYAHHINTCPWLRDDSLIFLA